MRTVLPSLLLGLLLGAGLARGEARLLTDIEYGRADGESLRLDVSVPEGAGPFPVAILVHGGGWSGGDKRGAEKPGSSADISPWFAPLTTAQFTWFSINYRLAPAHRWPACFEDVQTAIRWVKAHAAEYHGDPRRIALFGHSAGGHLVCLAAVLAKEDTRVQAVVGFAPVTDFEQELPMRGGLSIALQNLHGRPKEMTPGALALLRETSPINHVQPGLPPFLLVHGDADKSVPYQQSLNFQARLKANGVPCDLFTIPGAPHRFTEWSKIDATYSDRMIAWLRKVFAESK
ncbi:MAG TPA: alpha/beta hydrolase [Opitutaceae bacterium]|nr:alpha/beta hydrolase [Opitutaceae bacterium]